MTAGQDELAGRSSLVNRDLNIRSELRKVLNLVDDASTLVSLNKRSWVLRYASSYIRLLKVDQWQGRER
jgi:hypothetical protein